MLKQHFQNSIFGKFHLISCKIKIKFQVKNVIVTIKIKDVSKTNFYFSICAQNEIEWPQYTHTTRDCEIMLA